MGRASRRVLSSRCIRERIGRAVRPMFQYSAATLPSQSVHFTDGITYLCPRRRPPNRHTNREYRIRSQFPLVPRPIQLNHELIDLMYISG